MLLKYKNANILAIGFDGGVKPILVKPGVNFIPDDAWKKASENPAVADLIAKGEASPLPTGNKNGDPEAAPELQGYSNKQSTDIVKDIFDIEFLRRLESTENRAVVQAAIAKQVDLIVGHRESA
jgi:hypothetical protein